MSQDVQPKPLQLTSSIRRVGIYATVLLVVFLFGFIPMWVKARGCESSLAEAEQRLGLARMQNDLSSAAIYARRGDYEPARQAASQFFTALRAETEGGAFTRVRQHHIVARSLQTIHQQTIHQPVPVERALHNDLEISFVRLEQPLN